MAGPGTFSFVLLGDQTLLVQCAESLRQRGHQLRCVVTEGARVAGWAAEAGVPVVARFELLQGSTFLEAVDYVVSVTNLRMLPAWLLQAPRLGAFNFHDGPLPRHAGLNAPVWALLQDEPGHGIAWHELTAGADRGRVLASRRFPIAAGETAFSLNAQCYQAGHEAFVELLDALAHGMPAGTEQDPAARTYHGLADRPPQAGQLDWTRSAADCARLVRALDFGPYPNPVLLPKLRMGGAILVVREARVDEGARPAPPGTVLAVSPAELVVACADGALVVTRIESQDGLPVDPAALAAAEGVQVGSVLVAPLPDAPPESLIRNLARHEGWWMRQLATAELPDLPFAARDPNAAAEWVLLGSPLPGESADARIAALLLLLARLNSRSALAVAYEPFALQAALTVGGGFIAPRALLSASFTNADRFGDWCALVAGQAARAEERIGWLADLPARQPALRAASAAIAGAALRIVRRDQLPGRFEDLDAAGAAVVIVIDRAGAAGAWIDGRRFQRAGLERLQGCWLALREAALDADAPCIALPLLPAAERALLQGWSTGAAAVGQPSRVHELFAAQVAATPDRIACVFHDEQRSYLALDAAANRLARHLQSLGVARGDRVGVHVPRSLDLPVALLAVHKAGAAYVPLDPTYPADRLAWVAQDADLRAVITRSDLAQLQGGARVELDRLQLSLAALPGEDPRVAGEPADAAYVIYTSGSTGRPKGVVVEHRQVANFFHGMDARLGTAPGTWLAVTSISFDISVLELLWTLARGFTVVLHDDELRRKGDATTAPPLPSAAGTRAPLSFGLFYWNVARSESDHDADKYRLLLESAKYADANGFDAIWTPERHFESFGGLFPNPSVTSAALAMVTNRVQLRAGSCVVPLHSPIRVAEEWAVVDNLSNGRVGISVAAGWAPPDFAIRPEAFADAKRVMFESTEVIKRLWRGETVNFPGPKGEVPVRTLPRPVQKELPVWVTTAGNIDTYVQAGKAGANVLTHLLGQTVEEVAAKVRAYREAWKAAGHPGHGIVSLMLHTLVGTDRDAIQGIVREPLKAYLRSAVMLVKAAAWQFPTFRRLSEEQGKSLDDFFATISAQDMDDLLEFAFQRYFNDSGLFGTPEHCLAMLRRIEDAGIDEVACLIDYGIATDVVLDHLPYLTQLRRLAQEPPRGDHSLTRLLQTGGVTHFQCTPSMATLLVAEADARPGLAGLRHLLVGGEALPPDLAQSLCDVVAGSVWNMYGPTETTVWSACDRVQRDGATASRTVPIGTPLAGQSVRVVDPFQQPLPQGIVGEIVIGGHGVARGYWRNEALTAERFVDDPDAPGERLYRTGDLGRFLPDGRLECLGRRDQQVKLRGYRIELGEIEALLRQQPEVAEAAVILREDTPGDRRLVAYLRTATGRSPGLVELRTALARALPEFMVPSAFVTLPALPLTPNGKIDRNALPAPAVAATGPASQDAAPAAAAPATGSERLVIEIWQRALGNVPIGLRDNFFDLGGHSLLVVQVLKELREKVSRPVQMTDLFRYTTVEALARFIDGAVATESAAQRGRSRAEARRAAIQRN